MEEFAAIIGVFIMLAMMGFMLLFYFGIFAFLIFAVVIWVLMLLDVVKRKFPNESDRTTWILVVALTGWIGALIYYFSIKKPADAKAKRPEKPAN